MKHFLIVLAVLGLVAPSVAAAARVEWVPSISARGEYDDNVEFEAVDPDGDLAAWVSPGLSLRSTTERSELEAAADLDLVRYADRSELNRFDQFYRFAARHDATERFEVRGSASYREGSTLESQLEDTGQVTRRSPLYQVRGGGGASYRLSARAGLGVDYGYFKSAYASGTQADFDAHDVSLTGSLDLRNQLDRITVRPAYRTFDSERVQVDDGSLTVGWRHPMSETWVLDLAGGGRYTRFDTGGDTDQQWGGIVDATSTWSGEITRAQLGFNLDLTYGSEGIPVERERVRGSVRRALSERAWASLSADLARTRDLGTSGDDRLYGAVSPSAGFRVTPNHTVALTYRYAHDRNDARAGDEVATRSRVWLEWRGEWK